MGMNLVEVYMLNIIIGENSIGKTVVLKERLKELGVVNVSTNLVDDINTDLDIDLNKVERLNMKAPYDVDIVNGAVNIGVTGYEKESLYYNQPVFRKLVGHICASKDYFIYDEPEFGLSGRLLNACVDTVARLAWTFKECWISTYESGFLAIPDANLYTVENGELKQLTFDEAIDMNDSLHDIEPTYEVGASGNFNITYLDEFKHTKDEWFVHEVDVNDFRFINAYRSLSVEQVAEALRMFKVITHCSIINLLTHSLGYQVLTGSFNFVSCPLRGLSDAEKLFLQCFLAEASKTPLVIQNNLNTLTNS
jgi:hypothetical protein